MQQQSFVTTTKQRLLEVSLNKLNDKDKRTIITFSLPLGSYLPAGMQLYFDDVREKSVPFIYCDQAGCFIKMILDEPLRKKINTSEKLSVVITSAQDRSKPIQIPFSNKGFKKALSKLK
jgi:invasion protein IalB